MGEKRESQKVLRSAIQDGISVYGKPIPAGCKVPKNDVSIIKMGFYQLYVTFVAIRSTYLNNIMYTI